MLFKQKQNNSGFSLIEVMVTIFILAISLLAIFSLYDLSLKVAWENKTKTIATNLANQKIEMLRNLPYDNVGTVGGIPSGEILQTEQIILNNISFTVESTVIYIDDPFDGKLGQDDEETLANDYKKVQITVSWTPKLGEGQLIFYTDISPQGLEEVEGGGTLKINVFDSSGAPLNLASVNVVNDDVFPAINMTVFTNPEGILLLPGTPASTDGYHISVTKDSGTYSTDQTYEITAENVNPVSTPIIVNENQVASASFSIDQVSNLNMLFQDVNAIPISGVLVHVNGQKIIGTDPDENPIYKFDEDNLTTDIDGEIDLENIEWDSYNIETDESSPFAISQVEPTLPINVFPFTNNNIIITLEAKNPHSILFVVEDNLGNPINNAQIDIHNVDTSDDQTGLTTLAGQFYFSSCDSGGTNIEITASGFSTYQDQIDVSGYITQKIILTN
jgi:prepilin-type N-terminal cleavage/methylation domain-containing protein